jgi:hypothetical protein
MSIEPLDPNIAAFMQGNIHACPMRGHSTSFQLVDEFGDGKSYAGLTYEVIDYEDTVYTGKLDATGSGKVENHYRGPVVLKLNNAYRGIEKTYTFLQGRPHYPLPITELQVRAEKPVSSTNQACAPRPTQQKTSPKTLPITRLK